MLSNSKHQQGVDNKKEWIKSKLKGGHVFRKLKANVGIFIFIKLIHLCFFAYWLYRYFEIWIRINVTLVLH